MYTPPTTPIQCPTCGKADDWCVTMETTASADLSLDSEGFYREKAYNPDDPPAKPTRWFWCGSCGEEADDETAVALEERIR